MCKGNTQIIDMDVYVSNQFPFLLANVDGLVTCFVCGEGIPEIKCPCGKATDKWSQKSHKVMCAK